MTSNFFLIPVRSALAFIITAMALLACSQDPPAEIPDVTITSFPEDKRIDVLVGQELFTSYIYPDGLAKPVLFPINVSGEIPLTRGFPLTPRTGERADHPHQVGHWLNYGNVNGLDFWNNPGNPPEGDIDQYGFIEHGEILRKEGGNGKGELVVSAYWKNYQEEVILTEVTTFVFSVQGETRVIDRVTTLTAGQEDVLFTDDKEGMIAIRVARELELPGTGQPLVISPDGDIGEAGENYHGGSTGNYLSSEGIEGDNVWGTRAQWMRMTGSINGRNITLAILDHPENTGYPTYWHARGYGLFSANPLGQAEFSEGREELNMLLPAGEAVTFRYRIVTCSGEILTPAKIDELAEEFTTHIL